MRLIAIVSLAGLAALLGLTSMPTNVRAQGGTCPVAPSTLGSQPYITVKADQDHVNVRSGPNSYLYDKVGLLLPGESAPALGRTSGGDWIEISCPGVPGGIGWVYSANVTLTSSGFLQIVEAPPTPEIAFTLDATMIAAYDLHSTATRLPTFTPPAPPQSLPTYVDQSRPQTSGWMAPLISGLALAGLVGIMFSFLFRR
jgi:uncharacterized protein YraI